MAWSNLNRSHIPSFFHGQQQTPYHIIHVQECPALVTGPPNNKILVGISQALADQSRYDLGAWPEIARAAIDVMEDQVATLDARFPGHQFCFVDSHQLAPTIGRFRISGEKLFLSQRNGRIRVLQCFRKTASRADVDEPLRLETPRALDNVAVNEDIITEYRAF